jgi:hypothetical protein
MNFCFSLIVRTSAFLSKGLLNVSNSLLLIISSLHQEGFPLSMDMTQHRDMEILELLEHDTVGYNN